MSLSDESNRPIVLYVCYLVFDCEFWSSGIGIAFTNFQVISYQRWVETVSLIWVIVCWYFEMVLLHAAYTFLASFIWIIYCYYWTRCRNGSILSIELNLILQKDIDFIREVSFKSHKFYYQTDLIIICLFPPHHLNNENIPVPTWSLSRTTEGFLLEAAWSLRDSHLTRSV